MRTVEAAEDFYVSGTFWLTVVSVLVAIALVVLGVWGVRRQAPKRRLTYRYGPTIPMIANSSYASHLKVLWKSASGPEKGLDAPHVVGITLTNSGRADLPSSAFDAQRPIEVTFGAECAVLTLLEVVPPVFKKVVDLADGTLQVKPILLRKKKEISITLLAEGSPIYDIDAPLVDFDIVEAGRRPYRPWVQIGQNVLRYLVGIVIGLLLVAVFARR